MASLEHEYRYLVVDVDRQPVQARGSVYVGTTSRHGDTSFGNRCHPPGRMPDTARRAAHCLAVDAYWRHITDPQQEALLTRVCTELKGRVLACHCVGRPCITEEGDEVEDACLPCHAHCLAALANCTSRQRSQLVAAVRGTGG